MVVDLYALLCPHLNFSEINLLETSDLPSPAVPVSLYLYFNKSIYFVDSYLPWVVNCWPIYITIGYSIILLKIRSLTDVKVNIL